MRNIIGHRYANVNKNIIWDVIKALSELKGQVQEILKEEEAKDNTKKQIKEEIKDNKRAKKANKEEAKQVNINEEELAKE